MAASKASKSLKAIKPALASVPITLDKPRRLLFDMNALAELEERYGSATAAFAALQNASIKAARFLLWAGLMHEDESLTERQVGAMVSMTNIYELMEKLGEALEAAFPEPDSAPEQAEGKEPDPT